ncbi:MAG: alpha/beta hydrolase [Longimicrobiales bacterium]
MLHYVRFPGAAKATGEDDRTVVLLHGRGADETDLSGLRPLLPANWTILLPRGPFAGSEWGYGGGWAWYRYLGGDRPEPDSFARSLVEVAELLAALPALTGAAANQVVLGGFSQGGTVSLGYALAANGAGLPPQAGAFQTPRPASIANLSGFLPSHPRVRVDANTVAGQRFFWAHGRMDPAIPFAMATAGRGALRDAGANLFTVDEPGGHWIEHTSIEALIKWVNAP